ncbi:hypothetical protein P0092_15100 [Ruminiclostridium papyrosolvens DSM 2782]|uniref:hypothetical protein n=1 Tax=Ruminiclostridium papyrosolvens TaxID=29362 RepID=UPI0023E402ED|nr:hypothetical protein [Ruminiclostridium papyrosolvens]WES33080.1 hypothetical protein P0092_15100 [Ruminiclostridium papyrosolvens DSM 2782]
MPQLRRGIIGTKGESGINPCEGADSFGCLPLFLLMRREYFCDFSPATILSMNNCRDVGSIKAWTEKRKDDDVFKVLPLRVQKAL